VPQVIVRLNDQMANLDLSVSYKEPKIFKGKVKHTALVIEKTLAEHGDRTSIFCLEALLFFYTP
jgi:hypothetical protein